MAFQDKLIMLLKNIELNLAYNALYFGGSPTQYALPLQGGGSLLYVTQGDGALRLCPGLLCYGLSAHLNARLRRASYLPDIYRPSKCTLGRSTLRPYTEQI